VKDEFELQEIEESSAEIHAASWLSVSNFISFCSLIPSVSIKDIQDIFKDATFKKNRLIIRNSGSNTKILFTKNSKIKCFGQTAESCEEECKRFVQKL